MSALSVRVSEDPARPLGHAIVTLGGLPRTLETFEFALSRHGFAANHLGPDGWQGAECWLQPEEAWYGGDALKFVVRPDLAFQLENMPYKLAVRGQGLAETATVTFVWPLELELEAGTASGERRVVGGTRVDLAPKPRPEPVASDIPPVEPPPLPEVGHADLPIPDVVIPEIGAGLASVDDNNESTQVRGPHSTEDAPTQVVEGRARPPVLGADRPPVAEPAHQAPGRLVPPAGSDGQQPATTPAMPAPPPPFPAPGPAEEPATVSVPPRRLAPIPEPPPVLSESASGEQRAGASGLLIGWILLAALAALAALGWWWFSQHAGKPPIESTVAPLPSGAPAGAYRAPEPIPAPEPVPAPEPIPAPEPVPAPEPIPAPEPAAPEPAPVPLPVPVPMPVAPVAPVQPGVPPPAPTPPAVAPIPKIPPNLPPPVPPARPGSGRSLEDELKSQFDPTQQELEKGLRRHKPSP